MRGARMGHLNTDSVAFTVFSSPGHPVSRTRLVVLDEPSFVRKPTAQYWGSVSKLSALGNASVGEPSRRTFVQNVNIACFKRQRLTTGVHHGLGKGFEDSNTHVSFVRRFFCPLSDGRASWFILGLMLRRLVLNHGQRLL